MSENSNSNPFIDNIIETGESFIKAHVPEGLKDELLIQSAEQNGQSYFLLVINLYGDLEISSEVFLAIASSFRDAMKAIKGFNHCGVSESDDGFEVSDMITEEGCVISLSAEFCANEQAPALKAV